MWAYQLQDENVNQTFMTTNCSQEAMNAFLMRHLPRGQVSFRGVVSNLKDRVTQLTINENSLMKHGEWRNRGNRRLTMKRSIRLRTVKQIRIMAVPQPNDPTAKEFQAKLRVLMQIAGRTHCKYNSISKIKFDAWVENFRRKSYFLLSHTYRVLFLYSQIDRVLFSIE